MIVPDSAVELYGEQLVQVLASAHTHTHTHTHICSACLIKVVPDRRALCGFRTESDAVCIFSPCEHTLNCSLLAWKGRKRGEDAEAGLVVMLRHSNCHLLWRIKYPQKQLARL